LVNLGHNHLQLLYQMVKLRFSVNRRVKRDQVAA
jgi:hypothetical protein